MDNLTAFLSDNKVKAQNEFYAVSDSFKDSDGNVIKWEIKPITTCEDEDLRYDATILDGDKQRLDVNKYIVSLVARSVVYPDLYDAKLQDSYNVKTPEALLKAMVDKPGEYNRLVEFVQKLNGFTTLKEDIAKAKN